MYKFVAVLFLLCQVGMRTSFALEVDFDGNGAKNSGIDEILRRNDNSLSSQPVPNKHAQEAKLMAAMLTRNGELVEVKPVSTWRDKRGVLNERYEFWPGTVVRWHIWCGPENHGDLVL